MPGYPIGLRRVPTAKLERIKFLLTKGWSTSYIASETGVSAVTVRKERLGLGIHGKLDPKLVLTGKVKAGSNWPDDLRIEVQRRLISGEPANRIARRLMVNVKSVVIHREKLRESGELPTSCPCGKPLLHLGQCEWRWRLSLPAQKHSLENLAKLNTKDNFQLLPRYPSGRLKRTKGTLMPQVFPAPGTRLYEVITTDEESKILLEIQLPARDLTAAMVLMLRERGDDLESARSISIREAE